MLTKYLISLAVVAIVATSIALGFAPTATASHNGSIATKVSNFAQITGTDIPLSAADKAQLFTTGTRTDGYTITSVKLKSLDTNGQAFAVSLCFTSSGVPSTLCNTLTPPRSFPAGELEFTVPGGRFDLAASTTYAVVLSYSGSGGLDINATGLDGEDSGKAAGWSINNTHHVQATNNTWSAASDGSSMRIQILAREIVSSNARLSGFGLTGATLSKDFRSNQYDYRTEDTDKSTFEITLQPTLQHSSARFRYLDADDKRLLDADMSTDHFQVSIEPGDTLVKVVTTAEDGTTTRTYTLALLRGVRTTEDLRFCGNARDNACPLISDNDAPMYGTIASEGQEDWAEVRLERNTDYIIGLHQGRHLGSEPLRCRTLDVYAPNNARVGGFKSGINGMFHTTISHSITASITGLHKLKVTGSCYKPNAPRSNDLETGNYKITVVSSEIALSASEPSNGDLPATTETEGRLLVASPATGRLEDSGDSDWYQFNTFNFDIYRFPTQGLEYVAVYDEDGNHVWDNQAASGVGGNRYFRPTTNRAHYIAAINTHSRGDEYPRNYEIQIEPIPVGLGSPAELDPLTAVFVAIPSEHDGTAFTVHVEFSDDITATADNMRQHGFTVNGGSVTGVAQVDDRADLWNITVTPAGSGDVTIGLPATTDCTADGAICTSDGRMFSNALTQTVRPETPFLAYYPYMPDEHENEPFTFPLYLGKPPHGLTDETVRDHLLAVTGGTVTEARRTTQGDDQDWTITVAPEEDTDVLIVVQTADSCDEPHAVCTESGQLLEGDLRYTVDAPALISVANAADTAEASGATLDFTVTLSRPSDSDITVEYATSDGTATEGGDYTDTSGTLTFTAGETEKTINVPVLVDDDEESDETVTLTLSDPSGAVIETSSATGMITNVTATGSDSDDTRTNTDVTITLSSVPNEHDGTNAFTFNLALSSNLQVGYQAIADAVDATGATVTKAKRTERGSNQGWRITLTPSGQDTVSIAIAANSICDRSGSPCNTNAVSATVAGPN